ncbi:MAG: hypothetical protein ACLU9S_13855 [Oscillospiraceae bacterium]
MQIQLTGTASISANSPKAVLTAKFTNFTAGFGAPTAARTCRVTWFLNSAAWREQAYLPAGGHQPPPARSLTGPEQPDRDPVFTVVLTCGQESEFRPSMQ